MLRRFTLGLAGLLVAVGSLARAEDLLVEVDRTRLHTGLVLLLGADGLKAANSLVHTGRYLVRQLVVADRVAPLRREALDGGLHGPLSIAPLPADGRLPYPSRFVDLVVADPTSPGCPPLAELHRVTNVGGRLLLRDGDGWRMTSRPPEPGIADWSHKWRDASGNNLSPDEKSGPPQTVQWQAGPAFADGSGSGQHPVVAGGAFACVTAVDGSLVVRSAGNGLIRWRSEPTLNVLTELVIAGDRLLARADPEVRYERVLGKFESGQLCSFDLASGKRTMLPEVPVMPVEERFRVPRDDRGFPSAVVSGETLVVAAGGELAVLDLSSGKRTWTATLDDGIWFSPRVLDDQVIAVQCPPGKQAVRRGRVDSANQVTAVAAYGLADGKLRWRNADAMPAGSAASLKPLTCADGKVFLYTSSYQTRAEDAFLGALSARTGKLLWRFDSMEGDSKKGRKWSNTDSASFIMYRDSELIYVGGHGPGGIARFDAGTGKMIGEFHTGLRHFAYGGECSMSRGTKNWLIKSAVSWYDRELNAVSRPAARSQCGTGAIPAQGMVFTTPIGCDCTGYARGYLGMASEPAETIPDDLRLTSGPGQPGDARPSADDWPIFLANPGRTSNTRTALPEKLTLKWKSAAAPKLIAGPLLDDRQRDEYWIGAITPPTVVDGTIYVGLPDTHAVSATDAATGKRRWIVPVGGPVDTPPTIAGGLCVFGCQDGQIYALSTTDGRLVWKFNGALGDRSALLNGRLTSACPAPGSVVVRHNHVYATVGYHAYLGGVAFWMLDLTTGKPLARHDLVGGKPDDKLPNLLNDILCEADNGTLWIGQSVQFTPEGKLVRDAERKRYPPPEQFADHAPVAMSRRSSLVTFTNRGRGGSTHGWASPAWLPRSPITRGFRVVPDGKRVYFFRGDRQERGELVGADVSDDPRSPATPAWTLSNKDAFGNMEVATALIKAGDRVYLGGGSYDGMQGAVFVIGTRGKVIQRLDLPARPVPCGLAATRGQLIVTCVDGQAAAFEELK